MSIRVQSELEAIRPLDDLERAHREDALAWVASGAQLYRLQKPANPPKHLVSYFAVVDRDHVLLVDHRNAQLWLPTGGQVEPDEDPRTTVIRELREELGLVVGIDCVGPPLMVTVTDTVGLTRGHTDVSLWYVVTASRDAVLSFDKAEFNSVRWFHFSEVPLERSDPHMGRFLEKLRETAVS
jgi:8-oxo-dGTP diphosphatase